MIIGIGNPLVAAYARCYLCIAGINALNKMSDYKFLQTCFKGFIDSYEHVSDISFNLNDYYIIYFS